MSTACLACPACGAGGGGKGTLRSGDDALHCQGCGRVFPVVLGIPDLRIDPDPWIGLEEDRAKGVAVEAAAGPGFEAAVRYYWEQTPETPARHAARHIDHVLHAVERTGEWLARLEPAARAGESWLDLGCGTADLACVVPGGVLVTGLDVAFRWLVIAKRRLAECGRSADLVCGNAEALPFASGSFDRVVALGTLEHCQDATRALTEARRVLRPGGLLHVRTVNRFTLLREPHVGVWGVGWLPRRWADRYVHWRSGQRYLHHQPLSAGELRRAIGQAGFRKGWVLAAPVLRAETERLPGFLHGAVPAYEKIRRAPLSRAALRWVAPLLEAGGIAA